MVNLEQIKADIAARKAMPAWGPNTSIERIKTINVTLPSFSLKTVEALIEALEKAQQRNAEMESCAVKLPQLHSMLLREDFNEDYHTEMAYKADEVQASLAAAGIKWEV